MQNILFLSLFIILCYLPVHARKIPEPFIPESQQVRLSDKHKDDWVRVLIQPNGWGRTPEAAIADLERVMRIYQNKPGFILYDYKKVIAFSKYLYQCDGQCSYLTKRGLRSRRVKHGARYYTSTKK
ncbi:MAG: hypothetical protein AAGA18_02670 [Verrucomicrobiota bacterium]